MVEYVRKYNQNHVLLVNIESVPALEALDEILAVPGLDGVLLGPHDLSCSLGVPEQYDHPRFEKAVHELITKARAHRLAQALIPPLRRARNQMGKNRVKFNFTSNGHGFISPHFEC